MEGDDITFAASGPKCCLARANVSIFKSLHCAECCAIPFVSGRMSPDLDEKARHGLVFAGAM